MCCRWVEDGFRGGTVGKMVRKMVNMKRKKPDLLTSFDEKMTKTPCGKWPCFSILGFLGFLEFSQQGRVRIPGQLWDQIPPNEETVLSLEEKYEALIVFVRWKSGEKKKNNKKYIYLWKPWKMYQTHELSVLWTHRSIFFIACFISWDGMVLWPKKFQNFGRWPFATCSNKSVYL